MSDQNHLDDFLASAGIEPDAAPTADTTTTTEQPEAKPNDGPARDPATGKFAPKPSDEAPVATTAEPPQQPATTEPAGKQVPLDALTAIRGENRELKQQLQQALGRLQALEQRPAQPQQPQQPKPKREIWDDPDGFVTEKLSPVEQQLAETRVMVSHAVALADHGKETVQTAFRALNEAVVNGQIGRDEVNAQLAKSRDPVGDIVRWHQQQSRNQVLQRVGEDPDAFVRKELDRLLGDPAEQAKILERIRGSATAQTTPAAPPATQLPPTISRLPGANAPVDTDVSSEGLFRHAMAR